MAICKKANGKLMIPRLGDHTALFLRSHGGVQTTKKGKKGYDRNRVKSDLRKGY